MTSRTLASMCLGLLGAIAAGCVVSPQPSPPDLILDGDRIGFTAGVELVASVTGFEAAPGTVDPPRGVVVVTNLDANDAPSFADVQPDGSFVIAVPGLAGQRYRFQAKSDDARSLPFDLDVSSIGAAFDTAVDEPDCLVVTPARWIAFEREGDARSVVIQNQCNGAVQTGAPRLRRGLAGMSFSPTTAVELSAGQVTTITVRAGAGGEAEDVLLLDVTAPALSRRAITLTVPDR